MCLLLARSAAALSALLLLTMLQHSSAPALLLRAPLRVLCWHPCPAPDLQLLSVPGLGSAIVVRLRATGTIAAGLSGIASSCTSGCIRDQGASRLYCPLRGGLRSRAAQWHPGRTAHVWVGPGGHPLLDSQYPSQVIPKTHLYRRVRWVTALIEPNPRLLAKCSHLISFTPRPRHLISRVRG